MTSADKLTLARVSSLAGDDTRSLKAITASNLALKALDDLSVCVNLTRLDLSHNLLRTLRGLEDAVHITWLNVAHNELTNLDELARLRQLRVVNASHNHLVRFDGLKQATELRALVLSDNRLLRLDGLTRLKQLNSLIVSNNRLSSLEGLSTLTGLTTLAAAHNELRDLPSLAFATNLEQLRLNDNKLLTLASTLTSNARLKLLDIGNNLVRSESALTTLQQLPALVNLNLRGNPICEASGYPNTVRESIRSLRILDGERFDPGFLRRKLQKQQAGNKPHPSTTGGSDRDGSSANASGSDGETAPSPKKHISAAQTMASDAASAPTLRLKKSHSSAPDAASEPRSKKHAIEAASTAHDTALDVAQKPALAEPAQRPKKAASLAVPSSDLQARPKKSAQASDETAPGTTALAARGKRGQTTVEALPIAPARQDEKSGVVAVIAAPLAKKRKLAPSGDVWSRLTAPDADLGAGAATSAWT